MIISQYSLLTEEQKEKRRKANREYWHKNEHYRKRCKEQAKHRRATIPALRDSHNASGQRNRQRQKQVAVSHYGGRCVHCGETDIRVLEFDHINNDGAKHRRAMRSGELGVKTMNIHRWLAKNGFPQGVVQLLCCNCNRLKLINGGVLPGAPFKTFSLAEYALREVI